jgi:hypothetical protein
MQTETSLLLQQVGVETPSLPMGTENDTRGSPRDSLALRSIEEVHFPHLIVFIALII